MSSSCPLNDGIRNLPEFYGAPLLLWMFKGLQIFFAYWRMYYFLSQATGHSIKVGCLKMYITLFWDTLSADDAFGYALP